jgi:NAD(P)-dependent dehydrogenase (short-subunit alcohol dehydrogenase family)
MSTTWLITGGSSGLGRLLATAVLEAGDTLVVTSPETAPLADLADRFGTRVRVLDLDVADAADADTAVQTALDAFGRLDVVVTSAVEAAPAPVEELSLDVLRAQLDATLLAAMSTARAALPVFRRQRSGHFLQLSSATGAASSRAVAAAVEGFAESLHAEVAPLGVRVTVVEAGALRTDPAAPVGLADYRRSGGGSRPGDPARAARVLLDVVAMEHPPLRLPLGSDALRTARQSALARVQETELWADVSRSIDAGSTERGMASVLHLLVPEAS